MVILHKKYAEQTQNLADEPKSIMSKFPEPVRSSFNEAQVKAIIKISQQNDWKRHPVDIRFTIPFFTTGFYVVFIAGKSKRENKRSNKKIMRKLEVFIISLFLTFLLFLAFGMLYLFKSALGLDFLPDTSFGLWDSAKDWFGTLIE